MTSAISAPDPMCLRPLVNRNPEQTARNYANGYDGVSWAVEPLHFDDQRERMRMQEAAKAQ